MIVESMARRVATLLLVVGYCSCMEMRETVERTVMVRTTGSDLQPAATGYIYKKESDGPVSVTKMGETEVIEQFSKLYDTPKSYKEPTVRESTVDLEKGDEIKAESSRSPHVTSYGNEKYTKISHDTAARPTLHDRESQPSAPHASDDAVKPVVEKVEDKIDGIANEEFDKLFEDYIKQINSKNSFVDYLHGLGRNDHDIYHGYGDQDKYYLKGYGYGEKGLEESERYPYQKGETKDGYLTGEHENYYAYNYREPKSHFHENDEYGKHYIHRQNIKGDDHSHEASQKGAQGVRGFHAGFKFEPLKKNNEFYDEQTLKGANHDYRGGHEGYQSGDKGYDGKNSHESGNHDGHYSASDRVEKESGDEHDGAHTSEDSRESEHERARNYGTKGQLNPRKSYGYEIKH